MKGQARIVGGTTVLLLVSFVSFRVIEVFASGYLLPYLTNALALSIMIGVALVARYWKMLDDRRFLQLWVGASVAFAALAVVLNTSYLTTVVPFTNYSCLGQAFDLHDSLRLLPNLYSGTVTLGCSGVSSISWPFAYLPLLLFYQLPFLPVQSYYYLILVTWVGILYLIRKNSWGLMLFASPWVATFAASGYGDFVPLLFVTLAFVTMKGYPSRFAEVVALGMKQFANVLIVGYYLLTRRWRRALEATLITIAIVLPFFLMDPSGFYCDVVSRCAAGDGTTWWVILSTATYIMWPTYVAAVFAPRYGMTRFKMLLHTIALRTGLAHANP